MLGYLAVSSGDITDEVIKKYIDEQEGEQVADDLSLKKPTKGFMQEGKQVAG